MTPGPSSLILSLQKSSNLTGFSRLRTPTTSTKLVSAPKGSLSDGEKTTTKLSHPSPSTPPFALSSHSSPVARTTKSTRWTSTQPSSIAILMKLYMSNNQKDSSHRVKRTMFVSSEKHCTD